MRIVIVEDEKSIRNGLKNMLPKLDSDYQVIGTASDGLEGLALIRRTNPDLVIMDIHMPEMDGLTMLEKIRGEGINCRVVVLTAYSDFSYAKKAIALNIDNYLLKPIKIPELQETLKIISQSMEETKPLSLEQIIRASVLAEVPAEDLRELAQSHYGLDGEEALATTTIWLGDEYEAHWEEVIRILEAYLSNETEYQYCLIPSVRFQLVCVAFYHMKNLERLCKWYGDVIVPAIQKVLPDEAVYYWVLCRGLGGLPGAFELMNTERKWNLTFAKPQLIVSESMVSQQITGNVSPIKYPLELEDRMKQAIIAKNHDEYEKVLGQLRVVCTDATHDPEDIREVCVRMCLAALNAANATGKIRGNISAKTLVGNLSQALTWRQINQTLEQLFEETTAKSELLEVDSGHGALVKKATQLIEEYYDQGITLEELADRLGVSEEHLSTQYKKETGKTFSETVRKLRIDRVKELLLHSNLKLNQIADMVGYSDPKYMSKVFRDEVGMLPAEFRKEHL